MIYSLRNLKILQIENHVQDKTNLTNSEIKELFQDLMFKSTGIYFHYDQVTSDVEQIKGSGYEDTYKTHIELFWAEFYVDDDVPNVPLHIVELNDNYYFNILNIIEYINDDLSGFYNIIEEYMYGIIKADMYQSSGLILESL